MDRTVISRQHTFTRRTLLALIVLIFVGALCAWYVAQRDGKSAKNAAITNADTTLSPAEYSKRIGNPDVAYKLDIKDRKVVSGPTKIVVKKGQSVNVDFSTPGDEVDLELEGYNIITETNNVQDASGGFHFIADKRGTFKFFIPSKQSEHAVNTGEPMHDIQLGTIEVR